MLGHAVWIISSTRAFAPVKSNSSLTTAVELSRRDFVRHGTALAAALAAVPASTVSAAEFTAANSTAPAARPLLTPAGKFRDVSRGKPVPHSLTGEALVQARLTPETWRLELLADPTPNPAIKETARLGTPRTLAECTAIDLPALMELGRKHEVQFLKAMQCLNIPTPLGQGLWAGVPLREVLRLGGVMRNVRRVFYSGFHNDDPKQLFQSSLSYSQAMETPPGELPVFLAYRLNGEPLSLTRGGPVRMVVPWAHGFKSIKWLQRIVVTNDYRANDTYAEQNNDPEAPLKTAAYLDTVPAKFTVGQRVTLGGLVISGLSGLQRVEYALTKNDEAEADARWVEAQLDPPPSDWQTVLPAGVSPRQILGFNAQTGQPATWPLRYGMAGWSATLPPLAPGKYAVRARAVDGNGFAQPEPRPIQKAGSNALQVREFEVS